MGENSIVTMVPIIGMDGAMGHFRWLASRLNNCQDWNSFFQQWVGRMWGTMAVHPTSAQRKSAEQNGPSRCREIAPLVGIIWAAHVVVRAHIFAVWPQSFFLRLPDSLHEVAFPDFQAVSEALFQQTGILYIYIYLHWCSFKPVTHWLFWGFECPYRKKNAHQLGWSSHF